MQHSLHAGFTNQRGETRPEESTGALDEITRSQDSNADDTIPQIMSVCPGLNVNILIKSSEPQSLVTRRHDTG